MDERTHKVWSIHTLEYYSAKKEEIPTPATARMKLEDMSETSSHRSTKTVGFCHVRYVELSDS